MYSFSNLQRQKVDELPGAEEKGIDYKWTWNIWDDGSVLKFGYSEGYAVCKF